MIDSKPLLSLLHRGFDFLPRHEDPKGSLKASAEERQTTVCDNYRTAVLIHRRFEQI